jgi:Ca2+-transporting ATPase
MMPVDEAEPPWAATARSVARKLGVDPERGLDDDAVLVRLEEYGTNELDERERESPLHTAVAQFTNTMTAVLGAAVIVTLLIGEYVDTVAIAVILLLNALVGFVQARRAQEAMAALRRLTTTNSHAVRAGRLRDVPSPQIVPGDVVELASGDVVPADLRLYEVRGLRINEAALTGESEASAKTAQPLPVCERRPVVEQHNMAFKGTAVTYGRARGIVVTTGMTTEVGKIARLLARGRGTQTPLQRRLAVLGRRLAVIAVAIVAVVFVAGVARGEPADEMFLTAVSLAVAAIPEGLPAVVTVSLALGARRMVERHALVRKLPAVETLGSVTVICSDKTGTLTENRMIVERAWTPSGWYDVGGTGYEPVGAIVRRSGTGHDGALLRAAAVSAACNDAVLHAPALPTSEWTITGDPTEGALLAFAGKLDVDARQLRARHPRRAEIAFDAARRRMTTVHRDTGGSWVAVKGALSALVPLLEDEPGVVAAAEAASDSLTSDGYRVLALAERHADVDPDDIERPEQALRLVGLVGIADPARPEAASAIATCAHAGITTVMITGDDPRTAVAVARRLGFPRDAPPMHGSELDATSDDELIARVADIRVYARTDPAQKLRIVDAWKARGAIVAMTGDGVNDAPALQRADIGVAMGVTGTDVSKEAADMVLADDNFATIVHAVEEGRRIYDNIRRFVRYLLTTNAGELLVMFVAPLLGMPLPLLPLQILWINLVTDGLPAVALGLEPAERHTMDRPPRDARESILGRGLWQHAVWVGSLMAFVVIATQAVARHAGWPWQTMVFTTLALLQLGHAMAVRSEETSTFALGIRTNLWLAGAVLASAVAQLCVVYVPGLQHVFDTEALDAGQLAIVVACSTLAFAAVEIEKLLRRRTGRRRRTVPRSGPGHQPSRTAGLPRDHVL